MAATRQMAAEADRIQFLLDRDGYEATRSWVERTLDIYRAAIDTTPLGADRATRHHFEHSIAEFEAWLAQ